MIVYTPGDRARFYNSRFPDRVGLAEHNDMVGGCWMIGACYKNPNRLYGAYPYGYLERVHAMFPDARNILHVFSGGLTAKEAVEAAKDPKTVELVDLHGPEQGRFPTWQGTVHDMPEEWSGRFDLILADPPYSSADAKKYDCPMVVRRAVIHDLRRVCRKGGNLVWLDQVWPQHRKSEWKTWGTIGLIRSTNHRARVVSLFEAV